MSERVAGVRALSRARARVWGGTRGCVCVLGRRTSMSGVQKKKSQSTAAKAGLALNVKRVETRLRAKNRGRKLEGRAAVFAAGVAQAIVAEVNALAVAEARARSQKRVLPTDVQSCLRSDPDLGSAFLDFSFVSTQALPKAVKFVTPKAPTPRAGKKVVVD